MRAFVLAVVAMAAVSVGSWYALGMLGFSSGEAQSSATTRL